MYDMAYLSIIQQQIHELSEIEPVNLNCRVAFGSNDNVRLNRIRQIEIPCSDSEGTASSEVCAFKLCPDQNRVSKIRAPGGLRERAILGLSAQGEHPCAPILAHLPKIRPLDRHCLCFVAIGSHARGG